MTKFAETGDVRVTVQVSCGSSMLQDSKVVHVFGKKLVFFLLLFHTYCYWTSKTSPTTSEPIVKLNLMPKIVKIRSMNSH